MLFKKRVQRYMNKTEKIINTPFITSVDKVMMLLEIYDKAIRLPGCDEWCKSELLPIIKNSITNNDL